MKSVFDNQWMNLQECKSYVTACERSLVMSWVLLIVTGAQNWKTTKDGYLKSLAASIGTAHKFPEEVADALGCYMIGEVIGCVLLSQPQSMSGMTECGRTCPAYKADNRVEPRCNNGALKQDSTERSLVFERQSRRAPWLLKTRTSFPMWRHC